MAARVDMWVGISIFCWESSHATSVEYVALLSTWITVFGRDILCLFTYTDSGVRNSFGYPHPFASCRGQVRRFKDMNFMISRHFLCKPRAGSLQLGRLVNQWLFGHDLHLRHVTNVIKGYDYWSTGKWGHPFYTRPDQDTTFTRLNGSKVARDQIWRAGLILLWRAMKNWTLQCWDLKINHSFHLKI